MAACIAGIPQVWFEERMVTAKEATVSSLRLKGVLLCRYLAFCLSLRSEMIPICCQLLIGLTSVTRVLSRKEGEGRLWSATCELHC